jgi:YHS domain-containing protein
MGRARKTLLTAIILLTANAGLQAQTRTETVWPDTTASPAALGPQVGNHIEWVTNWAEAQALATRYQRPVLVHFWDPNCAPCMKLERTVFNQPECIRVISTNYVPWKVNVVENAAVARDLRVQNVPTDVILSASGKELYRGPTPQDMNRYIATLDQVTAHARLGLPAAAPGGAGTTAFPAGNGADPTAALAAGVPDNNSAFPLPNGNQPAPGGGYPLPSNNPTVTNYPTSNGYQLPGTSPAAATGGLSSNYPLGNTVFGPPPTTAPAMANQGLPSNPNAAAPTNASAGAGRPQAPAYVANQWATAESRPAPGPIAEQRASFTAPSGGEFQPPAAAAQNAPARDAANPPAAAVSPGNNMTSPGQPASGAPVGPPAATTPGANASTLGPPITAEPPAAPSAAPLGLDGYCPVTLVEQEKWVKGDPKWGARHRGRLYLFISPEAQQRFLENFDKYAPALSGYDAVKYSEHGQLVDGKRAHGVFYRNQIYLFADEAALQQFWAAPERYATAVRTEHERSAMRPGDVQR